MRQLIPVRAVQLEDVCIHHKSERQNKCTALRKITGTVVKPT